MKHFLLFLVAVSLFSCAEKPVEKKSDLKTASQYFPKEKTKVLVVGTFHFDYPGMDAFKEAEEDKIDVLKEPKKSEVTELVNYIKKFKPTKIAIEAFDNWKATEKLRAYKKGDFHDKRDERFQLGARIATELKLDTLYAIDAMSFVDDLGELDSTFVQQLFKDFDFKSDDPYNKMMTKWYTGFSKIIPKTNLLEYFKHTNSRESHLYGYGAYLVGDFKLDEHRGADILSIWWYNRNLRIFRKLQKITESKEDRILLIFGNGHAAILRQLLEASPAYEFVEFDSL